jgi:hypothetical protein
MAFGYFINPDLGLLYIRGQGLVTQRERIHTMLEWLSDPAYPGCVDALYDGSAEDSTPRIAELRELIAILRQRLPASGPRRLAMVTSKPIAFGVAQIFGHFLQLKGVPLLVRVFLDPEPAWAWLRPGSPPLDLT